MNAAHLALRGRRAILILTSVVLVAGCSAAASPAAPTPAGAASPAGASSAPAGRPSDLPIQTPPLVTVPPSAEPILGEVPPELVAAARADLAGRVPPGVEVEVIRAEEVAWPDGSLGCRVPGELYQALETPGYWIVLRVDGRTYDYRVAARGTPRLCERALPVNPGG